MISRGELIQVVQRIIEADGSEEEIDELISLFVSEVPHPRALDVLGEYDDAETIVSAALAYKPLEMPAPSSDNERKK
jgi:hypothetical protein